jgi:hypothetical protein
VWSIRWEKSEVCFRRISTEMFRRSNPFPKVGRGSFGDNLPAGDGILWGITRRLASEASF